MQALEAVQQHAGSSSYAGALVTSWTLYPLGTPQSEASQIARQRGHHPLVTKLVSKISDVVAAA